MSDPEFKLFVPYEIDRTKLLDRQFSLNKWPGPPDDYGVSTQQAITLSGREICALTLSVHTKEYVASRFDFEFPIGEHYYSVEGTGSDRGETPFMLLMGLLNGLRSQDANHRAICNAALGGGAVFYLLNRERHLTPVGDNHVYTMFARSKADGGAEITTTFRFSYCRLVVLDLLEQVFHMDAEPTSDSVLAVAHAARDYQIFFRTDAAGPLWTAVFTQRARKDAHLSRNLVLCLPEVAAIAADHLGHSLDAHTKENQAMMRSAVNGLQLSLDGLSERLGWLLIVVIVALASFALSFWMGA